MRIHLKGLFVFAIIAIFSSGCGSTTLAMPNPITEPVVDHPGQDMVRYRDRVIEIVVESSFANDNPAEEWLVLNVALSGMTGKATKVDRRLVSVRTPSGDTIPLPSYKEFNQAYDQNLQSISRRAGLASKPLDFTRGGRRDCRINFMPPQGSGEAANTAISVSNSDLCTGFLFFPVRGGVQPGNWKIIFEFEETEARVAFTLDAG